MENQEIFEKLTWNIKNFSKLKILMDIKSDPFILAGYAWRVILHPHCKNPDPNSKDDLVTISLKAVRTTSMSKGWSRHVKYNLSIFNQLDSNMTIGTGESTNLHEYNENQLNWAYSPFMTLVELCDLENGFVVNDTCIILVLRYLLVNQQMRIP
ncbi:ubiquitin C-terminal hydrolase 12-like [Vicia villosa]|uniref:ubiquitin C-terminal hydrolase 12-like n=1 Tax=Vicia villosa TaxID=3911 RepID=UPI00273B48FC|nr:ubiquitin C-terminal hydrolase 12-like [Vicia villosa]